MFTNGVIDFPVVTALIAGAFSAAVLDEASIRADDVTLTLEPQLTGGFNVVLIEGKLGSKKKKDRKYIDVKKNGQPSCLKSD